MTIKYTFFLKTGKNVVLTDNDSEIDMEKTISELTSILKSPKICLFSTKNDCVLLKSNEVQGVMIDSNNTNFKSTKIPSIKSLNKISNDSESDDNNEIEIEEYDQNVDLSEIYEEYDDDESDVVITDELEN